ncbi:MAG: hypothetical protein ACRD21_07075, partial [Vicinamibacteria bacterium]
VASYLALHEEGPSRRWDPALVFAFALLLRVIFLPTEPVLSDDVFRYVWDGRVQHAGINPYLYAPADPELAFLREELPGIYPGINNKDVPTLYPPLMQLAFFLATAVSESLFCMKTFFALFDLALIYALTRLLAALELHPLRALIYAWSPLSVVEVAASGHNEAFAVFFLVCALWAFERKRDFASMLMLAASGMAKLASFALVPLFARFVGPRVHWAFPLAVLPLLLLYASAEELAFRGLREYAMRWRGNDSLFHALFALTGSLEKAKTIAGLLLAAWILVLFWRRIPPLRASFWTLGALLLLSPIVHPWYLLWIAPLLAIFANPAWLYLEASVALSYHAMYLASPGEVWQEWVWIKHLLYGPFFVLLALNLAFHESRKAARDPRSDAPR